MDPRDRFILVTGGARSGKSSYAERLAARLAAPSGGRVTYLATCEANDPEMAARVAAHRATRPAAWQTVECPRDVPGAVRAAAAARCAAAATPSSPVVVLLDCVTLWVSNVLLSADGCGGSRPSAVGCEHDALALTVGQEATAAAQVSAAVDDLLVAIRETRVTMVAVTNEIGLGVVPEHPIARLYRDLLGCVNQRLAAAADRVYFLVAGQPLDVKDLAAVSSQ